MLVAFNWALRPHLHELRDEGRLNVLMALVLHANENMRCFPKMETIARETGYALDTVTKAKQWLLERGAIALVPYAKRIGKEAQLPRRQHVYQLTGLLRVYLLTETKTIQYLVMSPETEQSVKDRLTEISPAEISLAGTEGRYSDIEGNTIGEDDLSAASAAVAPASSSPVKAYSIGDEPQPKKARPRDVVFDAVVEHCFDTDPLNALEVQQLGGGRVGRIVKALRKAYAGVLEDEQIANELGMFAEAWAAKELTMPQHEDSLLPNFKKWRNEQAGTPAQVARALHQPIRVRESCDDPTCKGGYIKTAQGRVKCGNCWEVPDKVTA